MHAPLPDPRRWRPLKCEGGPLDGQRRRLARDAGELVEPLDDAREVVYRVTWRRPKRQPRFAVLRFVGVRRRRPTAHPAAPMSARPRTRIRRGDAAD